MRPPGQGLRTDNPAAQHAESGALYTTAAPRQATPAGVDPFPAARPSHEPISPMSATAP